MTNAKSSLAALGTTNAKSLAALGMTIQIEGKLATMAGAAPSCYQR